MSTVVRKEGCRCTELLLTRLFWTWAGEGQKRQTGTFRNIQEISGKVRNSQAKWGRVREKISGCQSDFMWTGRHFQTGLLDKLLQGGGVLRKYELLVFKWVFFYIYTLQRPSLLITRSSYS